jgi:hypothetical protein
MSPARYKERIGKCSNCPARGVVVRRIAGAQVCFACAKHLPGHLLRKVFPEVGGRGLRDFMKDNELVAMTQVDRPEEPAEREKTWREKVAAKLQWLKRIWPRK